MADQRYDAPWSHDDEFRNITVTDAAGRSFATVKPAYSMPDVDGWSSCLSHNRLRDRARLIKAAPDLLEALEWLVANVEGSELGSPPLMVKARAAIAKARGQEVQ